MQPRSPSRLSTLEYHVLLSIATSPLYGYAIKTAVTEDSDGALSPGAGSLYRVLARLMSQQLVNEATPPIDAPPHPGLARKYYALTASGREVLGVEAIRMRDAAALAAQRLGTAKRNTP